MEAALGDDRLAESVDEFVTAGDAVNATGFARTQGGCEVLIEDSSHAFQQVGIEASTALPKRPS
ncbi:hypothetical protein [Streptomyces gardneri]|uniref:hypothetical protein n=1 Tax=Streptomyces gardneri TaxID=66892 RepID=UPI0033D07CBE